MQIIDNFLSKTYFKEIQNILLSDNFPWFYYDNISVVKENSKNLTNFGFAHVFINNGENNSQLVDFIKPAMFKIMDVTNCNTILRCRADMTVNTAMPTIHDPHTDYKQPNVASIIYMNESDGDTIFYKDDKLEVINRVSPVPNRLVILKGHNLHTGCGPTKFKKRILINSNFYKKS